MTVLRNNFDGGPAGTTITTVNSGAVPGNDAFNSVNGGTGSVKEFSDANARPTAEFTARLATGSTVTTANVVWSTYMGSQSQVWLREYLLLESDIVNLATVLSCDNGSVYNALIQITSANTLRVTDSPQTTTSTFTTPIPIGYWFRLECWFQFSATAGNWEVRMYTDADSDTPTETKSGSNWNLGGPTSNRYGFGYSVLLAANWPNLYVSGLELNNEGWPGPAPFRPGKGVPGILTNPIAIHTD